MAHFVIDSLAWNPRILTNLEQNGENSLVKPEFAYFPRTDTRNTFSTSI